MTEDENGWIERHAPWMLFVSLMLFVLLLAYTLWTSNRDISAACTAANEVREEIRGLMRDFRQQTLQRTNLEPAEIQRRVDGYNEIIRRLADRAC